MYSTLYDHLKQKNLSWLLEIERIEGDDDDFYDSPLEKELDFDWKETINRIIIITLGPILPQLSNFNLNPNQPNSQSIMPKNFKKYSDKNEMALIKEDPDFWTPLSIVILFSMISIYSQIYVTSWIIIIWLFGSGLIFVLARVLGGEFNYNLVLGVIGYCLLPIILTGFVGKILGIFSSFLLHACRCFGVVWATASSSHFLASIEYKDKKILLAYPIFLLYVYFLHLYTGV